MVLTQNSDYYQPMSSAAQFQAEYKAFLNLFNNLPYPLKPIQINEHVFTVGAKPDSLFDLTIATVIHGNELGGLIALNQLLSKADSHLFFENKKVCIIIGNIEAAKKDVRFLEKDLNRCFGGKGGDSLEGRLAAQLEPYLLRTKCALDIHQTVNPTATDFFIFPEEKNNILYAKYLNEKVPIVVHEKDFSKDGMCLDTFVTLNGGIGITYEMGQIYLHQYQMDATLKILSLALNRADSKLNEPEELYANVFSWGEVFYSADNRVLIPGLKNFSFVSAGTVIGHEDNSPMIIQKNGYILFPKYGEAAKQSAELCRTICPVKPLEDQPLSPIFKVNYCAL